MIAVQIPEIGDFMSKLLVRNVFDSFYMKEGNVETFASFEINGELNKDFFSDDEKEQLAGRDTALWTEVKPFIYQLMRGKKLPVSFSFTLQLSDKNTNWLLEKYHLTEYAEVLAGLYLNIRYSHGTLSCITGMSYTTFVPDKRLEQLWDETALKYLKQNGIAAEQI